MKRDNQIFKKRRENVNKEDKISAQKLKINLMLK